MTQQLPGYRARAPRKDARPDPIRQPDLLTAKLSPPALPTYSVERREQLALLNQAVTHSLTLVSASAGSGKTTLLAQWCREQSNNIHIAWLTLDQNDNQPTKLLGYLCGALNAADLSMPEYASDVGPFLTALEQAARCFAGDKVVLVLDDAHLLHDSETVDQLRYVVAHSPAQVRWIIAGRGTPDLHSGSFALRDQLYRIGAQLDADTRFVERLASRLDCTAVTPAAAEKINFHTEGWLAGIKLALTQTRGVPYETAHDYFATVLSDQPPPIRQFLLACSVVDRINGELANALLASERGEALLAACLSAQVFLRSSDFGDHRFNALFLEYLRHSAKREIADQLGELHLRASHWYAAQRRYDEALHHALLCGDRAWRLDLLALATRCHLKSGAIEQALAWSDPLPASDLFAREALWTTHATALILSRRFAAARLVLQQAAARHATHTLTGHAVSSKLQTLQLMLALLSDRVSDDMTDCPLDDADFYLTGTLMSLQAYWLLHRQKFDAAKRRALQARDLLLNQGSQYGATHANAILCAALGYTAQYAAALEHCERVFALMQSGPRNTAWANAAITLAQVRYEQNRIEDAQALCLEALPKLASVSSSQCFAAGNIVLARTYASQGGFSDAWRVLDDLHGYLETGRSKYLLAQLCFEKIRHCLLQERTNEADVVAAEFALDTLEDQHAWHNEGSADIFIDAALARLGCAQAIRLLSNGHYDRCQTILRGLIADATHTGYLQRLVVLHSMQAVCFNEMQHPQLTFDALTHALALTKEHGFTRSVFDETPSLNRLLVSTAGRCQFVLPAKYFDKFADLLGTKSATPRNHTSRRLAPPLEPLTDRETTVLRLLSQGLTNQEICARSNIALTTTKWHLKNIFSKLDVGTRTAALARARALQLIE